MRNTARCRTGHDRPESAVTIAGIRNTDKLISIESIQFTDCTKQLATADALLVGRLNQAIFGKALSNTTFTDALTKAGPSGNALDWVKTQAAAVSSLSDAAFATLVLKNLSITNTSLIATPTFGTSQQAYDDLHSAMTGYLGLVGNASRGIVAVQLATIIAGFEGETQFGVYGNAAKAFNQQIGSNLAHSINTGNTTDIIAVPVMATGSAPASGGNFSYMLAMGNYAYQISGFGTGDKIIGPAGATANLTNTNATDGSASLQYTANGQTVSITLTGLTTAQDGALTGTSAFNNVFGVGALG